jgi:hypothetical protein
MWAALVALAVAGLAVAQTTVWGGDHVEMEITGTGARLEFDCAHGTIDEAVRIDRKGTFQAKGTFTPERSGPSRDGDASRPAKATYAGTITDDTMTLRIVVDDQDRDNTYVLARDRPGNVRKCR